MKSMHLIDLGAFSQMTNGTKSLRVSDAPASGYQFDI